MAERVNWKPVPVFTVEDMLRVAAQVYCSRRDESPRFVIVDNGKSYKPSEDRNGQR